MSVVVARDPSTAGKLIFPWPNPVPWGAEVVCTGAEVAILCPNWEVGETLGPGRHTVKHGNPQQGHVLAYFVNTEEQEVTFERLISLIDRSTGQPKPVRFFGTVLVKVGDPELMCHQLVGLPYHDLATGVLRSVDVSVSKNFERMLAKLCLAMATVSDLATPGVVAQLVSLVTGTHPLATAVTGLDFVRFERFGLAVGNADAIVWQHKAPAGAQQRAQSVEQDVNAPTTVDNMALSDPDEDEEEIELEDDLLVASKETIPVDANAVRQATAEALKKQADGPPPPRAPSHGMERSDSSPSVIVSEELSMPPPASASSTGSNPAISAPGGLGKSPFAPPPGRGGTAPGGPPPPAPKAAPPGNGMRGNPGGGPPPPAPRTSTLPPGMHGAPPPPARAPSQPGGYPGSRPMGPTAPPGNASGRVQPTIPGMGVAPAGSTGGRIQPLGPGGAPRGAHPSSPYMPSPSGPPPAAPGGPGQRRKTPPLGMPAQPVAPGGQSPIPIGSQVLVYWNDGLWHTATIRQFSQGQYQVSIDGSHAVSWVKPNQIRRQ